MSTNIIQGKGGWEYPQKDPSLEIVGYKGLMSVAHDLFGPNSDSSKYNPLFNNIRTGQFMSKPHHCTHKDPGGHPMQRSCFKEGHQAYCLEWITEGGRRVRCGVRFKVLSTGCGAHANTIDNSMNLLLKHLQEDKIPSISWSQLNDPERISDTAIDPADAAREENQAILAQHGADLEAMTNMRAVTVDKFSVHVAFEDKKVQKQRAEDEQRRIAAAARKSRLSGKTNNKKGSQETDISPLPERRLGRSILRNGTKSKKPDGSKWAGKPDGANA